MPGLVDVALALTSPAMIFALSAIGLVAGVSARHPFDLLGITRRGVVSGPSLPPNPTRRRHAFTIATSWLLAVGTLLASGAATSGWILGGLRVGACATATATATNLCLPSRAFAWWDCHTQRKHVITTQGAVTRSATAH